MGITATPYLPSTSREGKLGYDVALELPGIPLFLQFKIGHKRKHFVRGKYSKLECPPSKLKRPFWKYDIDTAKTQGQFQMLLQADKLKKAQVCYLAPRFTDWSEYDEYYRSASIIKNSMCVSPGCIWDAMKRGRLTSGEHRIVYDENCAYVCSKPVELEECFSNDFYTTLRQRIEEFKRKENQPSIGLITSQIYRGLDIEGAVRLTVPFGFDASDDPSSEFAPHGGEQDRISFINRKEFIDSVDKQFDKKDKNLINQRILTHQLGSEFFRIGTLLVFATVDK